VKRMTATRKTLKRKMKDTQEKKVFLTTTRSTSYC
jgi:hypothetical protein